MNLKSLLLCSAALVLTTTGAYAAAPEPEPTEYVRACDAFGTGYFYIPGTDTCLRIGGYLRADLQGGDRVYARKLGDTHRGTYSSLAQSTLRFSTASLTDWGTLRTFVELRSEWQGGAEYGSANEGDTGALRFGYIELGGLRVGMDETIFAYWTNYYGKVLNDDVMDPSSTRTSTISYTYDAGNGFSAILGVEQGNSYNGESVDLEDGNGLNKTFSAGYGYRFNNGQISQKKLSMQMHDYMPYVLGGLKYKKGWGELSAVVAYDSYYSEWAAKARVDLNVTDKLSVFLMGGYKSMDDYYNIDDSYGDNGIKTDAKGKQTVGIYRQVNSLYGDWGGHWIGWAGGSYQLKPETSINFQMAYNEAKTFSTSANIAHQLAPGLALTPEIAYIKWNDDYSGTVNGQDYRTSLKGKDALQGQLRLERTF